MPGMSSSMERWEEERFVVDSKDQYRQRRTSFSSHFLLHWLAAKVYHHRSSTSSAMNPVSSTRVPAEWAPFWQPARCPGCRRPWKRWKEERSEVNFKDPQIMAKENINSIVICCSIELIWCQSLSPSMLKSPVQWIQEAGLGFLPIERIIDGEHNAWDVVVPFPCKCALPKPVSHIVMLDLPIGGHGGGHIRHHEGGIEILSQHHKHMVPGAPHMHPGAVHRGAPAFHKHSVPNHPDLNGVERVAATFREACEQELHVLLARGAMVPPIELRRQTRLHSRHVLFRNGIVELVYQHVVVDLFLWASGCHSCN